MEGWYGFPILEGEFFYIGNLDIHLRDFGGEGGKDFGEKASLVPGESPNILGSLHKTRHHGS